MTPEEAGLLSAQHAALVEQRESLSTMLAMTEDDFRGRETCRITARSLIFTHDGNPLREHRMADIQVHFDKVRDLFAAELAAVSEKAHAIERRLEPA